jgi:hypothetical protein
LIASGDVCRVLVGRLIMRPRNARRLLEECVILARVTREEHQRLGGIYNAPPQLYGWMLKSPIDKLPDQGRHRYRKAGIRLKTVRPTAAPSRA